MTDSRHPDDGAECSGEAFRIEGVAKAPSQKSITQKTNLPSFARELHSAPPATAYPQLLTGARRLTASCLLTHLAHPIAMQPRPRTRRAAPLTHPLRSQGPAQGDREAAAGQNQGAPAATPVTPGPRPASVSLPLASNSTCESFHTR